MMRFKRVRAACDRASSYIESQLGAERTARKQLGITAVCLLAIVSLGVLDDLTGAQYSFTIFYVIPVALGALQLTGSRGYLLAFAASTTWLVAGNQLTRDVSGWASGWNWFGRFLTMSLIVFLLGVLRTTVVRLSKSEASIREFLGTAAHQLRTPIAGLIASAEGLTYETDPVEREKLVGNLVAGTDRARRLLSSLLEVSRLHHVPPPRFAEVDLASLCREEAGLATVVRPDLVVHYVGPSTHIVVSSADAIREALVNLVDNATRHACHEVTLALTTVSEAAIIDVTDDGPGLPASSEGRAFEPFVSMDGYGGAGLGLSIAAASLRSIGGELAYERRRGFSMTIPQFAGVS